MGFIKGIILLGFTVPFLFPFMFPCGIVLMAIGLHSTKVNPDRGFSQQSAPLGTPGWPVHGLLLDKNGKECPVTADDPFPVLPSLTSDKAIMSCIVILS